MDTYENKYKEALETARKINSGEGVAAPPDWTICEIIFPELKESEDERIRKAILDYLTIMWGNSQDDICGVNVEDAIAWLEKQGEKPVIAHSPTTIKDLRDDVAPEEQGGQIDFDNELNALLKKYEHLPKKELMEPLEFYLAVLRDTLDIMKWTEEDEAHLHSITTHLGQWIERHPNTCGADIQCENLAWLNSLKQRML